MDQPAVRRKLNSKILCFAVFASLFFHAAGIFWIKDTQIDFYSSKRAFMEHHMQSIVSSNESVEKKLEARERTTQLAAVFNNMVKQPDESDVLRFDSKNVKSELSSSAMVASVSLKMPKEAVGGADLDGGMDLEEFSDDFPEDKSRASLNPAVSLQFLKTDDATIAQELMQATESLQGKVASDAPDPLASINSIQTGTSQDAAIQGNSLKERSGLIDQGFANDISDIDASAFPAPEVTDFQNDLLAPSLGKGKLVAKPSELRAAAARSHGANLPPGPNKSGSSQDLNSAGHIASRDDFILKVEYAPKQDGPGYLFKLTLVPKPGVVFKRIKQNVFFLVDRSHSIRPFRYDLTKAAVMSALDYLQEGDTFNILVFDDKVAKFSDQNVPWTPANIEQAKAYIAGQKYGGIFATTDLYSSLHDIVPKKVADNEVNTAILLSDGDTFLSLAEQRETIAMWTQRNKGSVALFCVPCGVGNNLPLLELLSTFNRGYMFHSNSDRGIGEVLRNVMWGIQNPIGKDIAAAAVGKSGSQNKIILYPTRKRMPNLYEHIPFVIYGYMPSLEDFHVFIQGKYYDKWLDIKEAVSFDKAQKVSPQDLERIWAVQLAYNSYENYLRDGNKEHLKAAKKLLSPYRIKPAFQ